MSGALAWLAQRAAPLLLPVAGIAVAVLCAALALSRHQQATTERRLTTALQAEQAAHITTRVRLGVLTAQVAGWQTRADQATTAAAAAQARARAAEQRARDHAATLTRWQATGDECADLCALIDLDRAGIGP